MRPRPRAGDRRGGPAARLRALLPLGSGARDAGRGAGSLDCPRRRGSAWRNRCRRERRGRRGTLPAQPQRRGAARLTVELAALRLFLGGGGSIASASTPPPGPLRLLRAAASPVRRFPGSPAVKAPDRVAGWEASALSLSSFIPMGGSCSSEAAVASSGG